MDRTDKRLMTHALGLSDQPPQCMPPGEGRGVTALEAMVC